MSEALKVNTTLASLNLKCVFQQQNNAQHGNDFLNENEQTDNGIGAEGACELSEALKVNTTLTKLNLGSMQHQ